ncbi:cytochrome c (plasmid) [Methylocystis sp. MJC1]|uniref:c-type cytochrome n=1 Tax=Methylocystis sp. MJC1 TaxID=2654282 RepID=UPI001FEEA3AA|nr:c-type cytochrome [Methylocystis sp. MJC1]KAF2991488.1 Cytochrome c-552 [Methylocystis sp. MJC1]UZX13878.1 cytochrome c [Methylocystis sp. MJC1]
MNNPRLALLLGPALLAVASTTSLAEERSPEPLSKPQLDAKIAYCKTCHGLDGQGFRGAYAMPRLAGQQTEYLEDQLHAFMERRRLHPLMQNVARALNPATLSAIAAHFKELNPKPLVGPAASKGLIAAGKKLYDEGVPDKQIPACASCHGSEAKGDGATPRLAGQLREYTVQTLANWNKERGQDPAKPDASTIMLPIAQGLSHEEAVAVAAYLGSLD